MEGNPTEAVDAILSQKPLSLAKIALLEKAGSPVLRLDLDNLFEDIKAAYLYSLPLKVAVGKIAVAESECLEWLEGIGDDEYRRIFTELTDGLVAFYRMLPPAKKKTETESGTGTDGLQN